MKIFIIHASAGFGHKKIAESINELAISLYDKGDVSLFDILDFTPSLFKFLYSRGYVFLISKLTWLWAVIFFLADTKYLKLLNYNFRRFGNKLYCYKFIRFIKNENPDVIISTHFLVNELVSFLKERKQIKTRLISVVTDFGVHNFWIAKNIDTYVVACERTKKILISKNINEEKIRILGIPVRRQFLKQINEDTVRKKLCIETKEFTVLILTGSVGIGPIYQIVKLLENKVNVIVVCGNNKKLYERLKKLNFNKLVALGWIDYIEETMAVSDLIITKPGGSTVSECLIMRLPMIFFSIIPGQEYWNAQIISNYGCGFIIRKLSEIKEKVMHFKNNPKELEAIKNKIDLFRKHDSSQKIISLIDE